MNSHTTDLALVNKIVLKFKEKINVFHCVTRYGQDIDSISQVRPATIVQCFWRSVSPVDVSKANLLVELLFLRSGTFIFSAPEFALQDVKSMIECLACH